MTREKIMVDLFEFSSPTYYKWTKHQKRKIFDLLDYAFTLEELEEYLTTKKIKRVEKEKDFEILENLSINFLTKLGEETDYNYLDKIVELFIEHYDENSNSISLELFAKKLYSKDIFYSLIEENYSTKLNFKIIDIFNKEHIAILNYICKNYDSLKTTIDKITADLNRKFYDIDQEEFYEDINYEDYENDYDENCINSNVILNYRVKDINEEDE